MIEDALIGSIKVIGLCPNCGKAIPARKGQGRRRVFCSERCRSKYARQHPSRTSQEKVREHRCEYCGGVFIYLSAESDAFPYVALSDGARFIRSNDVNSLEIRQVNEPKGEDEIGEH